MLRIVQSHRCSLLDFIFTKMALGLCSHWGNTSMATWAVWSGMKGIFEVQVCSWCWGCVLKISVVGGFASNIACAPNGRCPGVFPSLHCGRRRSVILWFALSSKGSPCFVIDLSLHCQGWAMYIVFIFHDECCVCLQRKSQDWSYCVLLHQQCKHVLACFVILFAFVFCSFSILSSFIGSSFCRLSIILFSMIITT